MALAAATVWEVRSTGSDNNGGGYAGGGTDYTMQDAAQATLTVASIVHTTTTQINVAVGDYTVSAADIGNIVQVTGGTATAGFYHISAVDVPNNRWTVDKAVGAAGATVVGAMGGALASPGKCGSAFVAGNQMWVQAATYAITVVTANVAGGCVTLPAAVGNQTSRIAGYGATRGDGGRPTLQATGAIATFTLVTVAAGNTVEHLIIDGALKAGSRGMNGANGRVIRCKAINCVNYGILGGVQIECEASGCSANNTFGLAPQLGIGCWSHDNVTLCGGFAPVGVNSVLIDCIASNNAGVGFTDIALASRFVNCTSYGNTSNGFTSAVPTGAATTDWINCISYGNTGVGIATGANSSTGIHLAFLGANGGGDTTGSGRIGTLISLTADPFTNAAADDYSLNNAAGGGALIRAAGIPAAFPGGFTNSYLDGGAAQHLEATSPTFPLAHQVYAGVDRGDGTLGTLHASNISLAAGAGVNLAPGILQIGETVDDVIGTLAPPTPPTLPGAQFVYAGIDRGDGVPGTLHASTIAAAAGSGANLTPPVLLAGVVVDDVVGTHMEPVVTFPPASKVYGGTDRGDGVLGTLRASNIALAAGTGANLTPEILLENWHVDDVEGAIFMPPRAQVYAGVNRGDGALGLLNASNIAIAAGHGENLAAADLRAGVVVDDVTGALVIPTPPTFPPASKVYGGTDRGDGVPGTLHASTIAEAAGAGVDLTPALLKLGVVVDDVTGTFAPPPAPPPATEGFRVTLRTTPCFAARLDEQTSVRR